MICVHWSAIYGRTAFCFIATARRKSRRKSPSKVNHPVKLEDVDMMRMDCGMQSISGYIAFCDAAIIAEAASSRSIFRGRGIRLRRHTQSQTENSYEERLGIRCPTKAAFPFLHGD